MKHNFEEVFNTIELSEDAREKIVRECVNHKHVRNFRVRYAGPIAAALVAAVFVICTGTVYAAVSAYQAYMEKMSNEEVQERYEAVQVGEAEADSFSRNLTEEERERMQSLKEAYQSGEIFPESSMALANGTELPQDIYYDYVSRTFHLPAEKLTDEQLLQIIDVWEKANYVLQSQNAEIIKEEGELSDAELIKQAAEFMEQYKHPVALTDEEKIMQFMEGLMTMPYMRAQGSEFSMSDYECHVTKYGKPVQKYWVTMENDIEKYSIFFTPESTADHLEVQRLQRFGKQDVIQRELVTKETIIEFASGLQETIEYMGITTPIVKKEIYREKELVLTDEEGNRYKFCLSASDNSIFELSVLPIGKYDDIDLSGEVIE